MKFDDDFMRLELEIGVVNASLPEDMDWPPPKRIVVDGEKGLVREAVDGDDPDYVLEQVSCSEITDSQRSEMNRVCRGALYRYEAKN